MTDVQLKDLPSDFVEAIRVAQVDANKGWRPEGTTLVDDRVFNCPECDAPGMNTCWGVVAFICGGKLLSDGECWSELCGTVSKPTTE